MMVELGLESTVTALAEHYAGAIDGLIIDHLDADAVSHIEALV